ncbi:MAG: hypothetical protein E6G47_10260 [Actinobacteria bacterium]|nr:MAG: hypothetical protein E6G47_10260 [Actinomycetota bacterium]
MGRAGSLRPPHRRDHAPAGGTERMRARAGALVIAVALIGAAAAIAVAAARGPSPPGTLEGRVRGIASTLRCPVCQDLSVADSPSALATQMRASIAQQLQAGRTPDEIRTGFVAAYGGLTLVAWLIPFGLALAGLLLAVGAIRRWNRGSATSSAKPVSLAPEDRRLLDRALLAAQEDVE